MAWQVCRLRAAVIVSLIVSACPTLLLAQIVPRPPAGIYIDAEGVLRSREVEVTPSKKRLPRKEANHKAEKTVALRQIFERAKREQASGKPISLDARTFEGLLRVEKIIVDQQMKEIFLVGPTEALDVSDPAMPVGKESGRPALRMDDFVVALRMVGPGQRSRPLGCSIDLPGDVTARLTRAAEPLIATQNYQPNVIVQTMQNAIGTQTVRFFGLEPNTPFALVCLTADVGLKRLALGLDASPIKKIKSHLSLSKEREAAYNRWWFVAHYNPIGVSEDGKTYRLSGPRLRVLASDSPVVRSQASPAAQKFADMLNEHMEPLCEAIPSFADLQNVTDLAVVAALIAADGLDKKVDWDVQAGIADYVVPEVPIAKEVEPLVNFVQRSQAIQVATGGVQLDVSGVLEDRRAGDKETGPAPLLPPSDEGKKKKSKAKKGSDRAGLTTRVK